MGPMTEQRLKNARKAAQQFTQDKDDNEQAMVKRSRRELQFGEEENENEESAEPESDEDEHAFIPMTQGMAAESDEEEE